VSLEFVHAPRCLGVDCVKLGESRLQVVYPYHTLGVEMLEPGALTFDLIQ
jgi:hypothetical protein